MSYALTGIVTYTLSDEEARSMAELAIQCNAPSSALARVVLRLLEQRPSSADIDQLEHFATIRSNESERPKTCAAISRVVAAYRRQP